MLSMLNEKLVVTVETVDEGEDYASAAVIGWVHEGGEVKPVVNWNGKARILETHQYCLMSSDRADCLLDDPDGNWEEAMYDHSCSREIVK